MTPLKKPLLIAVIASAIAVSGCETLQQASTSPDYAKTRRDAGYGAAAGLVCRDQNGAAFVSGTDQLEQHGGLRLIFGNVHKIVQNQHVIAVQALDCGFQAELAACDLPPPGGPNSNRLAPFSSHPSPAHAISWGESTDNANGRDPWDHDQYASSNLK
jgi:hypothetical protein